jgi:hypothetical protein
VLWGDLSFCHREWLASIIEVSARLENNSTYDATLGLPRKLASVKA